MASRNTNLGAWSQIIRAVGTPLGFYVLSLLIVEATLGLVSVKASSLDNALRWFVTVSMVAMFFAAFVTVTYLAAKSPRHLVFGKEEHSAPQTNPSALRDQIEDLIARNVKSECLKNRQNG
jgi:hypothetical protein